MSRFVSAGTLILGSGNSQKRDDQVKPETDTNSQPEQGKVVYVTSQEMSKIMGRSSYFVSYNTVVFHSGFKYVDKKTSMIVDGIECGDPGITYIVK